MQCLFEPGEHIYDEVKFLKRIGDVNKWSSTYHISNSNLTVTVVLFFQVISAYVFLMRTQEHMLKRSGGSTYLEDPLASVFLKRDGDEEQTMENHYPNYEKREKTSLDERVLTYLKREMVPFYLYQHYLINFQIVSTNCNLLCIT